MLNLVHVKSFLAVIDTRGVRSAAMALELSPSTVVDHINQLDADLGTRLIVRRHSHATPTPQGARFLPLARALISTASRARELLNDHVLRISAASNIGIYLIQPMLSAYQRQTGTEIELWIGANDQVANRLECGATDVAVMEWWDDRKGFVAQTWRREKLVVIVSPNHSWADRHEVSVTELLSECLLGGEPGSGTGRLLLRHIGPVASQIRVVPGFGSTEAVKRAVRSGRGISIVMDAAVVDEVAARQLITLRITDIELFKDIKVIAPGHLHQSSRTLQFIEFSGDFNGACSTH
ncbi:MAG: LysR family transcriptional regulator, partial [Hyphomicrobium sp.]